MTSPLTTARQALIRAIQEWPETQEAFTTLYLFEGDTPDMEGNTVDKNGRPIPSVADMPCLLIYPTQMPDNWKTHRMERLDYFIALEMWTPGWRYLQPEDLWPKVRRAIWQSPGGSNVVPYVKAETGFYPNDAGTIAFKKQMVGQNQKAVQSIYTAHLWINDDPLGN